MSPPMTTQSASQGRRGDVKLYRDRRGEKRPLYQLCREDPGWASDYIRQLEEMRDHLMEKLGELALLQPPAPIVVCSCQQKNSPE